MVGGDDERGRGARAGVRDARARGRLRARRPVRRRPLREDGAQRHRVRPHAGLRRGLRGHEARPSSTSTCTRSPASGATARSCARGCSSCCTPRSRRTATTSGDIRGYVDDSGEGRWTIAEAIDENVPAPVITRRALRPLRVAPGRVVRRQGQRRAPQPVRRPRVRSRSRGIDADARRSRRRRGEPAARGAAAQAHARAVRRSSSSAPRAT